ncbi:hypothetical protein [Trichormus variabilis]|nr:hypothetical protein [Trichormus variabilis]MBD2628299.1 hypothetical protein [Trichormus variabilis FACHB-164]
MGSNTARGARSSVASTKAVALGMGGKIRPHAESCAWIAANARLSASGT